MKRCFVSLVLLALLAPLAAAHFIWVVPDTDGKSAQVIFSDNLKPDDAKLLAKIAKSEVFARVEDEKPVQLKWSLDKDAYQVPLPDKKPRVLTAVCEYGVVDKGKDGPFLLKYTATAYTAPARPGEFPANARPWERLELEARHLVNKDGLLTFQVFWRGKPLAGAEVVALLPGEENAKELTTGKDGSVSIAAGKKPVTGLYGFRVRHVEARAGEQDGKKYKESRQYATVVFRYEAAEKRGAVPAAGKLLALADKPKEDPAASKLLAEARAARAVWNKFPGFTADIEANIDGKVSKGTAHVSAEGKVRLENLDKDFEPWAKRELASLVGHRLDSGTPRDTPCAFADDVTTHPFGRAIRVLNDELHSSYRVRGKEIVVVNRTMKDRKFTITVLESITNQDGKLLTTSFVVDYWNLQTGELMSSEATSQTWKRVGAFDLPVLTRLVQSTAREKAEKAPAREDGQKARSLLLSNHKLLESPGK